MKYGNAPIDLGLFDCGSPEMMCYLYLPIRINGGPLSYERRLSPFSDLIYAAMNDAGALANQGIVYVTAKTLYVTPENPGNRPGWHVDGWGSGGDLNYVWSDRSPTEFAVQPFHEIPTDDFASMEAMTQQVRAECVRVYPDKHLLRLDESVVHRVGENVEPGMRTFIKISISRHRYNLVGNSRNYDLDYDWQMFDRGDRRNIDNKDYVEEVVA